MTLYNLGSLETMLDQASRVVDVCHRCDGGSPVECTCPTDVNPRQLIEAMALMLKTYKDNFPIQPLSRADMNFRHVEVELEMGTDNCGGFASDGGPCGGCSSCVHGMVSHGFNQERLEASRYQAAGLKWAPYVIDWSQFVDGLPGGKAPFCKTNHHRAECVANKFNEEQGVGPSDV